MVIVVGSRGSQTRTRSLLGYQSIQPAMLPFRRAFATASRSSLKIGLIPADGIGREVIPAARLAIEALGSSIPKTEFLDLDAGFEYFQRHGKALPEETLQSANPALGQRVVTVS